ncbi:hypothetical protein OSB04_002299 [Centaurea solstitialis]|uniref:RRM domain-containing protein n=1 Tax=Centaurea solstitialis TaxID=347529 RepID=A0AA38UB59_9ASTR|nr:hypothetical protein OSB04_002299 [Centaurea solstitialis]
MDPGKLFIGGISWDTNEDSLREYFQTFGEVVEAVIMKDRTTGRARGFGFVVFLDPAVAERVVKEKHMIDGRTVEAKKAVPRDDQQSINRSNSSIHGSPGPITTKKIFVGGLASTVTENDFKYYFDQFGTITDVVVMYDHNTQRPRGFGFITYDSEESVDKVLLKNFHELNGKMVEVKRAVPKELSPGPNRSQISGHNYGLSRVNSFLSAYSPSSVGGYGGRADGRFSPVSVGRYPPFSPSSYNVGLNSDSPLGTNYRNFSSNLGPVRALDPLFSVTANRYPSPIGYAMGGGGGGGGGGGNASFMSSPNHNIWGSGSHNYANGSTNVGNFFAPGNGFGGNAAIWGNPSSNQGGIVGGGGGSGFVGGNLNNGNEENLVGYGRNGSNDGIGGAAAPFYGAREDEDIGGLINSYGGTRGDSFYADPTWRSSSPELEVPGFFGYASGSGASDGVLKKSVGYSGYSVENRSNRGMSFFYLPFKILCSLIQN